MTNRFITQIVLENFQSHKHTVINFTEGLNLITGTGNVGKSSIQRAINQALTNKPNTSYIRKGALNYSITLKFSDGVIAKRTKGSKNSIEVIDGDKRIYHEKFGSEYPQEVKDYLGNPPYDNYHGSVAYSKTKSPGFLISLSPTDLPKCIVSLSKLSELQEACDALNKEGKDSLKQSKLLDNKIKEKEKEIEGFDDIEKEYEEVAALSELQENLAIKQEKIDSAKDYIVKYNRLAENIKKHKNSLVNLTTIADYEPLLEEVKVIAKKIESAKKFAFRFEVKNEEKQETMRVYQEFLKLVKLDTKTIREKATIISEHKNFYTNYLKLKDKLTKEASDLELTEDKLNRIEIKKESIISELKQQKQWCDSCNRPLFDEVK